MVRGVAVRRSAGVGRRAAVAAVCALLLAGALSGCRASKPKPTNAPPPPTATAAETPTVTPEPTPTDAPLTAPPVPAEMERTDEVGAMAAAEYFMALYGYVRSTGDLTEWDAASGQLCQFCSSLHAAVEELHATGDTISGGVVTTAAGEVLQHDPQLDTYVVQMQFAVGESARSDANGHPLATYPTESGWALLNVAPSARGWILMAGEYRDGPGL